MTPGTERLLLQLPNPTSDVVPALTGSWQYGVAALLGGLLGWGIAQLKNAAEIKKLKAESKKLASEREKLEQDKLVAALTVLEKVINARNAHSTACGKCTVASKALEAELKNCLKGVSAGMTVAIDLREKMCAVICEEVIRCLLNYGELQTIRCREAGTMGQFLAEEMIPELRRIAVWVGTVNMERLCKATGRAPLRVSPATVRPFARLLDPVPETDRPSVAGPLHKAIEDLLAA